MRERRGRIRLESGKKKLWKKGEGFDIKLKEILEAEILPMVEEFDKKLNQVKEIEVMENTRVEMRCDVLFDLPNDAEVTWRYAEELKTQEVDQFKEVTAGVDRLYSIPSANLEHKGTYQCEIYSNRRSIVRLYFSITVTPQLVAGHTELQEIFDQSLLPGGQLLTAAGAAPRFFLHLLLFLLTTCLTTSLLLLFLSLGVLYWLSVSEISHNVEDSDEEDCFGVSLLSV